MTSKLHERLLETSPGYADWHKHEFHGHYHWALFLFASFFLLSISFTLARLDPETSFAQAGDITPPTVSITSPSNDATISGTVTISANASDNVAITGVTFRVGTTVIGSEDTTAPYSVSWNTAGVADGQHLIYATARDTSGNTTNSSYVRVNVSNVAPTPPPPTSGGLLFFDDFEYAVNKFDSGTTKQSTFTSAGWTGIKDEQTRPGGAKGYLSTVTSIPGYTGSFPSGGSRTLAIEALPQTLGGQTDFYLQLGGVGPEFENSIPSNVWFQFWVYVNKNQFQDSGFTGGKFLYPCNTFYPCPGTGQYHNWLFVLDNFAPENYDTGNAFMKNLGTGADILTEADWDQWKLYQQNRNEFITPNRWQLVKLHMDTSDGTGKYEAWIRPAGQDWVKVSEWIHGVTPNFSWILSSEQASRGHRILRMPTTWGEFTEGRLYRNRDTWMYMDDFAMATSESALPTYSSTPPPPPPTTPTPPSRFGINDRVQTTSNVQVRSSAAGTSLGTQSLGALATVASGPTYASLSGINYWWWNLNFDTSVDGWVADDFLSPYTAPPPPPPSTPTVTLSASPTSISYNTASTLNWSSTNATSCTASGAWSGAKATSGSQSTGNLTTNQIYTLTCTGAGGTTAPVSTTVTVASVTPPPPPGGTTPYSPTTWGGVINTEALHNSVSSVGNTPHFERTWRTDGSWNGTEGYMRWRVNATADQDDDGYVIEHPQTTSRPIFISFVGRVGPTWWTSHDRGFKFVMFYPNTWANPRPTVFNLPIHAGMSGAYSYRTIAPGMEAGGNGYDEFGTGPFDWHRNYPNHTYKEGPAGHDQWYFYVLSLEENRTKMYLWSQDGVKSGLHAQSESANLIPGLLDQWNAATWRWVRLLGYIEATTAGDANSYMDISHIRVTQSLPSPPAGFVTGTPPPPPSDTTPPTVSVSSPTSGSTVSGSSVTISANASDNVGVSGVQFRLNGTNLGSEDTSAPYSITWNTTTATNGSHTLTAVARDAAGNTAISSGIPVTVSNVTPTPTPPPPTGTGRILYVDPNGNDSVTYANNSASTPWRTIGRATWGSTNRGAPNSLEAAQAGDTVIVRAGTYTTPGTFSRLTPSLNPVNNGTALLPIIIKSETVGGATIQPQITHSGTVRSATSNSVQLALTASTVNDFYSGGFIRITSGTGAGQSRLIVLPQSPGGQAVRAGSYDGSTRTASIQTPWDIIPDTSSQYQFVTPGPLIGTLNKQYVTWDGFRVVEGDSYAADTGPVVVWGSSNITIQNLEVIGTPPPTHFDNHNGIRLNNSTDVLIRNNVVHGFRAASAGFNNTQNSAGLMTYYTNNIVVENNHFYDVSSGFFPKGGNGTGHIYRYNKVENCQKAFRVSYHTNVQIYQNFVTNCEYAFQPAEVIGNVQFYNNTVVNEPWGVYNWYTPSGFEVYNNIFYNVTNPVYWESGIPANAYISNYNNYFNYTSFFNGGNRTFTEWQALGYDTVGSTLLNPLFVNPGAGDYRLQSNSPVRNVGRNGQTMGAYITGSEVIGLNIGGITPPPPTSPPPPPPTSPSAPVISNTSVQVRQGVARFRWTTDRPATSQVEHGFTTSYGTQSTLSSSLRTSHEIVVSNLSSGNYNARAISIANNLTGLSNNITFTVRGRPPRINLVTASPGSVVLNWGPISFSGYSGVAILRSTTGFINQYDINSEIARVTGTTYTDENVIPGTTYYYSLFVYDDQENYSDPATVSFIAPAETIPPPTTPVEPPQTSGGGSPSTGSTGSPQASSGSSSGGGGGSSSVTTPIYSGSLLPSNFNTLSKEQKISILTAKILELQTLFNLLVSQGAGLSQTTCSFARDLTLGSTGEDVRCLQKYLNAQGFRVSYSGLGSLGNESNYFGPATRAALIRWQQTYAVSPSSGYFGPKSRAQYSTLPK